MELVPSARRLYKDKNSEIDEKYYISKDNIYIYFDSYDCEMLINNELIKGNMQTIEAAASELEANLHEKRNLMSAKNRESDYKTYIFTNNIIRAAKLLKVDDKNSELLFASSGKHTKGKLMKIVMIDRPFIIINSQPLACNSLEKINAEGVYKIKEALEFNCKIASQDLHHLGNTIGRNIEKMEGQLVRESRKKDPSFYLPRLFSFSNMRKAQWEGQLVRNYNLLQCANMAGLLQLDPDETFKIIPSVISFDIKTAYMSVMINQPIFPGDLSVIDIPLHEEKKDYTGHVYRTTSYDTAAAIIKKIERLEAKNKWYYLSIDPDYHGDNPTVLYFLKILKPFRRNFKGHSEVKLKYVNQDQAVGFLKWDKMFYDIYYSIYMELSFEELLYNLFLLCPESKVVLMYSKNPSDYLPKAFRDSKMELYRIKEAQEDPQNKKISKLYSELTYGKGLQLHDFQSDDEVMKAVCNETINIAQSLTCCSYTRYRLVSDWAGFTPLYLDSDSIKFRFSPGTNKLKDLVVRLDELNEINRQINTAAGYPDSNLGSWNKDALYNYMIFLKKKCYIGYQDDGTTEIKLAGCDNAAAKKYFEEGTLDLLQQIETSQELTIPNGKKVPFQVDNWNYSDYTHKEVTYKKNA